MTFLGNGVLPVETFSVAIYLMSVSDSVVPIHVYQYLLNLVCSPQVTANFSTKNEQKSITKTIVKEIALNMFLFIYLS